MSERNARTAGPEGPAEAMTNAGAAPRAQNLTLWVFSRNSRTHALAAGVIVVPS